MNPDYFVTTDNLGNPYFAIRPDILDDIINEIENGDDGKYALNCLKEFRSVCQEQLKQIEKEVQQSIQDMREAKYREEKEMHEELGDLPGM